MLKYLGIFNFLLILCLFYLQFNSKKIEKLTNTDHTHSIDASKIQQVIQEKYEIDIESIRNLSSISKSLQEGGLTIPGNIRVQGHANIDGNFNYLPKGTIVAFNGTTAPEGWAICDGKNGTPNLKNRFIFGSGNKRFGTTGGEENHKLTVKEMPSHNHSMNSSGNHSHKLDTRNDNGDLNGCAGWPSFGRNDCGNASWDTSTTGNHTHTINNTGSNQSHNNMPPYYVLTYIMKL